jgi:hypothetical protein
LVTTTTAKPAAIEQPDGVGGPGKDLDQLEAIDEAALLAQRAVAVEEHGRTAAHAGCLMASATAACTRAGSRPVMHR